MQQMFKTNFTSGCCFLLLFFTLLLLGCATSVSSQVPMERTFRSDFHPYKGEDGESLFVFKTMYFNDEDLKQNEKYYDKWIETYIDEYTYCKRGYEIIKTLKQPFANGPSLGGHLVMFGKCK